MHCALQWKALPNKSDDEIHIHMRNRKPLTRDEVVLPLKQWKDQKAEELMSKLGYYPIAGWYSEEKNNKGKYAYTLEFSPTGEILYEYFIEKQYQNGKTLSDVVLSRAGTFEIQNDTIEINFTKLLGSRYNRPHPWDDPLEENLTIQIKVQPVGDRFKGESIELVVTQISGINLFENHKRQDTLNFTAKLLPPMEI